MQNDPVVREGMGDEFVMVYCENKRQEQQDFMNEISTREYRWFL
jgi:glutamine synthetase